MPAAPGGQSTETQPHPRAGGCPKESCDSKSNPLQSSLLLKDCTEEERKQTMLWQFMKNCLWEGLTLEKFVGDSVLCEEAHTGAGERLLRRKQLQKTHVMN